MRRLLFAVVAVAVTAAGSAAAPVKFVKFDEKTRVVTVMTGKKTKEVEKTYTLTDKIKFFEGEKEVKFEDALKKFTDTKAVKAFDVKADGDKVEKVTFAEGKKKAKKKAEK